MRLLKSGVLAAMAAIALSGCGGATGTTSGPWLGDWIQVNFLTVDDGGTWGPDDPSGTGFVAHVTESEWLLTDDHGAGCAITMSYSVGSGQRFTRQATALGARCPSIPLTLLRESGRLQFAEAGREMIEHFDLKPGDEIVAYKWVRR